MAVEFHAHTRQPRVCRLEDFSDWKSPEACCFPSTQLVFAVESGIFRLWSSPVETCLSMFDCVSLISGYWAICWRRWTERVRTVSPLRLTSVPAIVFCLVVGVTFLLVAGVFLLWFFLCCCFSFLAVHHTLRHT